MSNRMVRPWCVTLATVLTFAAVSGLSMAQTPEPGVKVGDTAPTFTLKDQEGNPFELKKLLMDKPVALVFYRSADW